MAEFTGFPAEGIAFLNKLPGRDKAWFQDHLLFRFWEGREKKTAPTLFVRPSPESIGFATGAAFASLDRWRQAVADDGTGGDLAAAIAKLSKGRAAEVAGTELRRVAAPYASDHPRGDLLRCKSLQIR